MEGGGYQKEFDKYNKSTKKNKLINKKTSRNGVVKLNIKNHLIKSCNELHIFYDNLFPNLKNKIQEWCKNYVNTGIFLQEELVGCATFNFLEIRGIKILNLLLFGVKIQNKGYGSLLIDEIKKIHSKIIVWVDKQALRFFIGHGFRKQKRLGYNLQKFISYHSGATFCIFDFTQEEIAELNFKFVIE
jgi:hypothetical protein